MHNKDILLNLLSEHRQELFSRFSVKSIGLFGSYVRETACPESDVDVLVEFVQPSFDNYMDLKFYLEDLFQSSVDLVMADALKPRLAPYVNSEVIYA